MTAFSNLAKIISAPIQIVDKTILEPIAYVAEEAARGFGVNEEEDVD